MYEFIYRTKFLNQIKGKACMYVKQFISYISVKIIKKNNIIKY